MFLNYYVNIYHIFYDICTTLNAQFAEFQSPALNLKSILSHRFRAVDTPNLLWLFHASLIQFDPVWSSFHIILSTIELLLMSFCVVLLWFDCPSCTHSQNHTVFTIQKFRILAPLEISQTSQPPPRNSFISFEFIDVSGTTYYGSYFTNNLSLISSTYTFITFLIM